MSLGVTRSDDDDDDDHRTNGSIDRSTPPRARVVTRRPGAGVDHGWGGVGSSRDRSMSPSACTSRDHAREIRGYTLQIPIHGVFSHRVRTYGARRGRPRDVQATRGGDAYGIQTARRRGDDGWIGREKNLFIEARARCRRKNDRACGSVSSAPRARRRRRRRRRPNRRRRAI